MAMKLSGKVALITGASRGIGKSVAEGFAREGARLFLVGHTDEEALQQTLAEIRRSGTQAEGGLYDVGIYDEVERIADAIGEYKTCADDERPGGQHDSHDNLSHRPILALVQCVPKPKLSIPRATHVGVRRRAQ